MTAWPPHMDGSVVFARWRQCAPHLIRASLDPTESPTQMAHDRDRQTGHATPSVTKGRICVRSTSMRRNNIEEMIFAARSELRKVLFLAP